MVRLCRCDMIVCFVIFTGWEVERFVFKANGRF